MSVNTILPYSAYSGFLDIISLVTILILSFIIESIFNLYWASILQIHNNVAATVNNICFIIWL